MIVCDICGKALKADNGPGRGEFCYEQDGAFGTPEHISIYETYEMCPECAKQVVWFIEKLKGFYDYAKDKDKEAEIRRIAREEVIDNIRRNGSIRQEISKCQNNANPAQKEE